MQLTLCLIDSKNRFVAIVTMVSKLPYLYKDLFDLLSLGGLRTSQDIVACSPEEG